MTNETQTEPDLPEGITNTLEHLLYLSLHSAPLDSRKYFARDMIHLSMLARLKRSELPPFDFNAVTVGLEFGVEKGYVEKAEIVTRESLYGHEENPRGYRPNVAKVNEFLRSQRGSQ